ncbi:MAG: glycosyltransferase, partial [Candidatus Latescibacteria bacterium]|nr:glycosyltransferase [Candidatus Latescibacterota bacterium]
GEVPAVEVRSGGRNVGFAAGCNRAAAGATTDHLLFLNPDAILDAGTLDVLVRHLDRHPECGVAGPALRYPDGRSQPSVRGDPTPAALLHKYTVFKLLPSVRRAYRRYREPETPGPGPRPVKVLMGCALLVRTDLFRAVGGFDERYFLYYEEADLCRRVREAGAQVHFVPEAGAVHEGGASASAEVPRLAAVRLVSAQRYVARFASRGSRAAFRGAFLFGFPPRAMADLLRDTAYAALYGLWPRRREKAGRKAREALASLRLLTLDLMKVAAG